VTLNPRQLILKVLQGAEGAPLSARQAVASCALFGIRENSVRVALVRLAAAGMIEAAGRGTYRLGPNAVKLADEVRTWRTAETRVRRWNGAWIAVQCGAVGRSDRAALRQRDRAHQLLGFREFERDFFVRPDNLAGGVSAVRDRLRKLGVDAAVFVAREFDAERDAHARALWNGKALTASYVQTRQRLEKWLAHAPALELEVAARESFLMGNDAIRDLVFDPLLPDPLVDVSERHAFVKTVLRFDAAGHVVWRKLLSAFAENEDADVRPAAAH
jgi:phenylacetic acid degradation operon negative regulatory protein